MVKPFARLIAVLTPKRSWSQFSLRTLLGLTAIICILLGGWHLLQIYGNRIEVNDVAVGEPIKVKVRYVRAFGPPKCTLQVVLYYYKEGYYNLILGKASRSWLCFYTFQFKFPAVRAPGELSIDLSERIALTAGKTWFDGVVKRRIVVVQ